MSDSVEAADSGQHWVGGLIRWSLRSIAGAAALLCWLVFCIAFATLLLPSNGRQGVDSAVGLANTFLVITIAYYAAALPFLILPMRGDQLFRWFLYLECGWVLCLLGNVVGLLATGGAELSEVKAPYSLRTAVIVTAGIFLIPMLVVMIVRAKGPRRLATVVALLFGWLTLQIIGFAMFERGLGLSQDQIKFALPIIAALLAGLSVAMLLPEESATRHDLSLFILFGWTFLLVGTAAFLVRQGLLQDGDDAGYATFSGIAVTILLAPAFSWLGMPWSDRPRFAWIACTAVSVALAGVVAFYLPVWDGKPPLKQIWHFYDGPHL